MPRKARISSDLPALNISLWNKPKTYKLVRFFIGSITEI